ncbi:MAG: Fe2+-dependent dioxygenase [Methylotenera sp.]|jgi:PKHD-type hydroxylase|uniref:Fe2+-dependent dioxygenase n=1 Tax=Methylotenera sp. TaxID=2051956 RepID=UPI00271C8471|nr:Fe2+-dependent dioxygenase [Methylotenera sp.]MDO9150039.1 Fe2+-dependent dioxygenase [Methylotenera sp.]
MLQHVPDVLTPDELIEARRLLANAQWVDGKVTAGTQAAVVKNNQQLPESAPEILALRQLVHGALNRNALFFSAALPSKILPPFFNRYSGKTNHYGFHVDNAMRRTPDGSAYVRADVSATLFLSEPDEYEGGELMIEDTFGRHAFKLKAGSMVVYPSSSVHQVTPVLEGARVACFMFIQSMVRDAEKRRILYDIDISLMQLRQTVGETEAVVHLTGVYHNLLRRWAE